MTFYLLPCFEEGQEIEVKTRTIIGSANRDFGDLVGLPTQLGWIIPNDKEGHLQLTVVCESTQSPLFLMSVVRHLSTVWCS